MTNKWLNETMEDEQRKQVKGFVDLLLRRKKMIFTFLLLATAVGMFIYTKTPKVYQSSSLIMYQRQKINPAKMSPDEERKISEMVNTVGQQVTSRTSLESIINHYDLYADMRTQIPMGEIIARMRDKDIEIESQKEQGDIFTVSYSSSDPQKARLVTNAIAAKFVEENIRTREERASETSAYINEELQMIKSTLDKKEKIMRDYKLQYYNEMPEQRKANMDRLNALQEQLNTNQNNMQTLGQTKLIINEQIANYQQLAAYSTADNTGDEIIDLPTLKNTLESLLIRYTDQHPDVIRIKRRIETLENQQAQKASANPGITVPPAVARTSNQKLNTQLKEIELSLSILKQEREEVLKQIKKYQKWVDAAPIREAEWSGLTRDYEELKKHYENLVAQSLAADSAETLEKRQKGSQFKVIEHAFLPEKPIKPDFLGIMAVVMFAGLGLGIGFALFSDSIDSSFKEASDIESYTGIPVICSVPVVHTTREKWFHTLTSTTWGLLFVGAAGLIFYYAFHYIENGIIIL